PAPRLHRTGPRTARREGCASGGILRRVRHPPLPRPRGAPVGGCRVRVRAAIVTNTLGVRQPYRAPPGCRRAFRRSSPEQASDARGASRPGERWENAPRNGNRTRPMRNDGTEDVYRDSAELVRRAQAGSHEALEELFARYYERVH